MRAREVVEDMKSFMSGKKGRSGIKDIKILPPYYDVVS